jgi:hypothetical protein
MSHRLVCLVQEHFHGSMSQAAVLMALARFADERGVCWPGRAALADASRTSYATVGRALRWLERERWLQRKKGFQAASTFRLNVRRLAEFAAMGEAMRGVPRGFEAFPEEARAAAQATEKKDNDHCDRHCDHGERHCDHSDRQKLVNKQVKKEGPRDAADFARFLRQARPGETFASWELRVSKGKLREAVRSGHAVERAAT